MFLGDIFISSSSGMTTFKSVHANTPLTNTSNTSIIAGSVTSVLVVIILVVLGIIFWRKQIKFGMTFHNNIFAFL